jgi:hypothetical protein
MPSITDLRTRAGQALRTLTHHCAGVWCFCPFPLAGGRRGWGSGLSAGTLAGLEREFRLTVRTIPRVGGILQVPPPSQPSPSKGEGEEPGRALGVPEA